ncbi:MAG: hypothetical protein COW63_19195 [Bacteroidetes bacterium CG18_big_fil_WC_8_21_14_2_50_41_14]|nr:MAG: hypothetical protein COW63_19195 [Bacteroidetes bacterium CG18_big_fil_WC_8_21_14_2_50_41_14]PJB59493.1 MAG: hypothetical protein CO098_03110 [Bacteroidetes bacterium CG_4_9_14_3_um_filter_41_19]
MKKVFFLIVAITIYHNLTSQNQWHQIHPYPTLNNLYDVHFNSEEEGWIIGNGHFQSSIMYTNDAGATWDTQISGQDEDAPYTSIFFIDDHEGWAAGWKCIFHTTDKGNTWESQQMPDIYAILEDVFFINHSIGWAVGERNTILKTTDGGESWNIMQYSFGSDMRFYSVRFYNELTGFVVGGRSYDSYGILLKTNDGGETWVDVSPQPSYALTSVTFIDTLTGWICGQGGTAGQPAELYKTTDGGQTWIKKQTENYTRFNDIHFVDQDTGMILDANNRVFTTLNGGISWDYTYTSGAWDLKSLSFWDNNGCYSVGYNGRIVKSSDGGLTWGNVGQSIDGNFTSVGFFNSDNGFATGYSILYRTENGGHSWTFDTILGSTEYYLTYFSGQRAYMLNRDFKMAKTSNAGEIWVLLDIPLSTSYYNDLQFVNENSGYLCGNDGVLKKTSDGGITWEDKSLSSDHNLTCLQFINEDLGWMVDMNSKTLIKSQDGGDTWSDLALSNVHRLFFLNENIGYVTTYDSKLFKTIDAGNTWTEIYDFTQGVGSVYFTGEFVGWYISGASVQYTYDGGTTWQDYQYFAYTSINYIFFLDDNQGWLAGDAGFVATCDFTVDMDDEINNKTPISVFPNPGREYVNIRQDYGKGKIIDVKLFNLQGQEIMHFPHLSEPNSFRFNVSGLQIGAYFIKVTTEQREQTIKIIVE